MFLYQFVPQKTQNKKCRKVFFALLFLIIFAQIFAQNAFAISLAGIGIRPIPESGFGDWFIYSIKAGESRVDYVEVYNNTDQEQALVLEPFDSEPSNIGAFALSGPNQLQKGIGLWVKLDEREVTLAPQERKRVRFTISIPKDADVGEHSGAITAMSAPHVMKGRTGAAISTRVGVRIYETVPGKVTKLAKIISFLFAENTAKSTLEISLTARNEGNVTLSPEARLDIGGWGLLSPRVKFLPVSFSNSWQLMRGAEVTTNWQWPKPYFGRFTFTATLTYEDENGAPQRISSETLTTFIIPWRDAIIALAVIMAIIALIILWILYRRIKYSGKGWEEYKMKEGDNVVDIAQQCGISWKTLVKVNKIKKPYFVKAGRVIFVPPGSVKEKDKEKEKDPFIAEKKQGEKDQKGRAKAKKRDTMKWVLFTVITILTITALIFAAVIFVQSIQKQKDAPPSVQDAQEEKAVIESNNADTGKIALPTPTTTPTTTPTPTPATTPTTTPTTTLEIAPDIAPTTPTTTPSQEKKEKISLKILNGSGVAGLAGKIAEKFSADEYQISTGNADAFIYEGATILFREDLREAAENIKKVIESEYKNIVMKKTEEPGAGVVVIAGKNDE